MPTLSRTLLCAALLSALPAAPAMAAVFTVGPPGTAGACTHQSIQAAIDAAQASPGFDSVKVAVGPSGYTNVALVVGAQVLALSGGWADCAAENRGGRTRLSGAGGIAAPVVTVQSSGSDSADIDLLGFELVDGDNSTGIGGGLSIAARGTLQVRDSRIASNVALQGGGIGIDGQGVAVTRVIVGEEVRIEDNRASLNVGSGGGIYVQLGTVTLGGTNTVVRRNRANRGGGVFLGGGFGTVGAQFEITSGGEGSDGIVSGNIATSGGGLYVLNNALARLYTTDALRPVRIDRNQATDQGGAIVASGTGARVAAWEAQFDLNQAEQRGGAFAVRAGAALTVSTARAGDAPPGTVACLPANSCNRVIGNRASAAGAAASGPGAVLMIGVNSNPPLATANFESTTFSDNEGLSLFHDDCDFASCTVPAAIDIRNSLIGPDQGSEGQFILAQRSALNCDLCTIADPGIFLPAPFATITSNGPLTLTRSILSSGRMDLIAGIPQPLRAQHVVTSHRAEFDPNDNTIVEAFDASIFADADAGNFALTANSPALDRAPLQGQGPLFDYTTPTLDLARRRRVVDLADRPDLAGPVDLGAFELPDPRLIFNDGFEPAP